MFASAYVQNGATVYIAARKEGRLREVADALNRKGPGRCEWVVADLSVRDPFPLSPVRERGREKERTRTLMYGPVKSRM